MALLIDGDAMSFRAAAYGRPHEATVSFLQQQFEDPTRSLNIANSTFFERARSVFEENYNENAMARLEAVRRNLRRTWDDDDIRPLRSVEELQAAKPRMQRWVMANPFVRNLYKQGRVFGYGDSYIDHKRQGVGKDHYDYRLATNGFATFNDVDGYCATTYMEELLPGDTHPTFSEQIDIFDTWLQTEHHLLVGRRDVTSPEDNVWG
jgi:hypothetical protein